MTKVLSKKKIADEDLYEVSELELQLPNGELRTYKNVRRKPTVSIYPITDTGEIYLISQYRYLYEKKLLEAVGGFVDAGESQEEAAKRELYEEAGIKGNIWKKFATFEIGVSGITGEIGMFLVKDLVIEEPKPLPDEDITRIKMPLAEAVKKVLSNEFIDAIDASGILFLAELKRRGEL